MFYKGFFVVLCCFWSCGLTAQNDKSLLDIYEILCEKEDLDIHKKQQLLDSLIHGKEDKVNQDKLARIYHSLLKGFYRKDLDKSIAYALKIENIGKNIPDEDNFYLKNDKNLVNLYYKKKQYNKSIIYGKAFLKKHPKETIRQAIIYRVLGNSYCDLGDFNEAISFYNKAIYILKEREDYKEEGRTLINLLDTYSKIDNRKFKDEVLQIIKRIDKLSLEYEFKNTDIITKELNAGSFYDEIGAYENAKFRYLKSLELSRELSDSLNICNSLINLGITNRKDNNLKESRKFFNDALPYVNDNEKRASLYNNLADLHKEEKDYELALSYYNDAISEFLQTENTNVFDIPNFNALHDVNDKVDVLGYIIDKANILMLIKNEALQTKYLQLALKLYTLSDQIVDVIYFESREEFSKLLWREEASNFYLNATEAAYLLNQPETAFYFIEKSKALLLLENITTSKAKVLAQLPDYLIHREYDLIGEIKKVEEQLFLLKKSHQDIKIRDSLKNEVFSKKQTYMRFIDSLETAYPRYHNFKKKITVFNSKMVQESLKDNEIVLQYKLSLDKGFVVLVTKSHKEVFYLEDMVYINKALDQYDGLIRKPFVDYKDQQHFKDISHKLYLNLFPFLKNNKDIFTNKKLIIIPDSRLNYIPFESFITNKEQDLASSYLINFCEVSYAYSYSSLAISHNEEFKNDFLAISPSVFKDRSLPNLLISESETSTIETTLNTRMIVNEAATKHKFLSEYGNSKVVHISTHGGVLNNQPWISFNDQKLMLNDIYFNNQKSNLVVLSACKTSHGELKKGEGVMSIARAFINSGSKSVVSSLWDINQQSTNEIITTFYSNLKEGNSKSEALRNAKISYINNHKNTSEASPFYWSSLVLTGDTTPEFDNHKNVYYIVIAILSIGLLLIVFLRFKKTA
ncbi:CHAT domain-containing tetratricopeptide repeat protein [uncultured Psychroserpens sp.]|uniref:CHAT domain-containing protein n=1 Tax=uncultured Psychroserpens sp. TaxID=255436 RepID=UPI002626489E|nr:CHAT domain-containing tetratricopeptide repeat protein [uncultured Psychroserpens sp.]